MRDLHSLAFGAATIIGVIGRGALQLIEIAITLGDQLGDTKALFQELRFELRIRGFDRVPAVSIPSSPGCVENPLTSPSFTRRTDRDPPPDR